MTNLTYSKEAYLAVLDYLIGAVSKEAYLAVLDYLIGAVEDDRLQSEHFTFSPLGLADVDWGSRVRYKMSLDIFIGALTDDELTDIIRDACGYKPHVFILEPIAAIGRYMDIDGEITMLVREHFKAAEQEARDVADQAELDHQRDINRMRREEY